jgi:hypothetical protein
MKTEKGIWDDLLFKSSSREALNERRKISLEKRDKYIQEQFVNATEQRIEMDRLGTKESMKISDNLRTLTETRKREEKENALKDIYGGNLGMSKNQIDDLRDGDLDDEFMKSHCNDTRDDRVQVDNKVFFSFARGIY